MRIKSIFAKPIARRIRKRIYQWAIQPERTQQKVFKKLIKQAEKTKFGKTHNFSKILSYDDFQKSVPVYDYEDLKPYIDRILNNEPDVLWPGRPLYFAKTSGTTSGAKYIPLTKASMPCHIKAARNALLMYIAETGNSSFLDGKLIFLQGSPIIEIQKNVKIGRLSGIVAHYVPGYLQKNRMPSWETNCIEDWETKINAIVDETLNADMRLISGIPSWVQMYFEKLTEKTGKNISEIFPEFKLFVYGGVNYEPYRNKFEQMIGKRIDTIELFPASEGFFAFQDRQDQKGMLLLLNNGIFYEFIPTAEFTNTQPRRLTVGQVEIGVDYVMIISTNAGLWSYNLGDTVQFTSLKPHRIIVSGRIKHFISAFGEHVIAKEVEEAMKYAVSDGKVIINEFTVAPEVHPDNGLPYHEWFIEFEKEPIEMDVFIERIDTHLQKQNSYYLDLIQGKVLRSLKVRQIQKGGFQSYMKSVGKLGGQNKVPRLSNDRKIADLLTNWSVIKPLTKEH